MRWGIIRNCVVGRAAAKRGTVIKDGMGFWLYCTSKQKILFCFEGDGVHSSRRWVKCRDHAWSGVASNRAPRCAKNSLTRRGDAPNKLLNLLEQLLHKIKANRRREIRYHIREQVWNSWRWRSIYFEKSNIKTKTLMRIHWFDWVSEWGVSQSSVRVLSQFSVVRDVHFFKCPFYPPNLQNQASKCRSLLHVTYYTTW